MHLAPNDAPEALLRHPCINDSRFVAPRRSDHGAGCPTPASAGIPARATGRPPTILLLWACGCSGSSFVYRVARDLLARLGLPTLRIIDHDGFTASELFRQQRNPCFYVCQPHLHTQHLELAPVASDVTTPLCSTMQGSEVAHAGEGHKQLSPAHEGFSALAQSFVELHQAAVQSHRTILFKGWASLAAQSPSVCPGV